MFATDVKIQTRHQLPTKFPLERAVETLHDFETIMLLSPDCRSCKPLPESAPRPAKQGTESKEDPTVFEVEDNLPLIPKYLWSGGVKYQADFYPVDYGCDITVYGPLGFTCTNHWRLQRGFDPKLDEAENNDRLARVRSKELMHISDVDDDWYIEIITVAKCPRAFVNVIKTVLKSSHAQLQEAFVERIKKPPATKGQRVPLGRRRSSAL